MEGDGDTVYCELKYSGLGLALLLSGAAGTIGLVVATPGPWPCKAAALAWVCGMSCLACRALLAPAWLRLDRTRAILVAFHDGHSCAGHVRDGSFVAPWLTIVRWRPEGARRERTLLLLPDALEAGRMRKIRVLLKWA